MTAEPTREQERRARLADMWRLRAYPPKFEGGIQRRLVTPWEDVPDGE